MTTTKTKKHAPKKSAGQYVIVRTYTAGVHCGTLGERDGKAITLHGAKRIWNWKGRNTLHEISLRGVGEGSRVSEKVDSITLLEAIEIIPATAAAKANIEASSWT